MTIEKDRLNSDPIHLTVDDQVPVHVHVKKRSPKQIRKAVGVATGLFPCVHPKCVRKKKPKCRGLTIKVKKQKFDDEDGDKPAAASASGSLKRTSSSLNRKRCTSKSPASEQPREPWVPPPAKTTTGGKTAWQGSSYRLDGKFRDDASGDDYEAGLKDCDKLKQKSLLKNNIRDIDARAAALEASAKLLEQEHVATEKARRELNLSQCENDLLKRSMDLLRHDACISRKEREKLGSQRDLLMKKLIEVEMDGQAAGKQVKVLRELTSRLNENNVVRATDSAMLRKEKGLLLDRLAEFESTNRTLRNMLQDRHEEEAICARLVDQKECVMSKLLETEDKVQQLRTECMDKDRAIMDLRMRSSSLQEENSSLVNIQESLECTKAHLQKQLRTKEADCNRMAVQIRSLESQLAQERVDVEHLQDLLSQSRDKADQDKEALKKATRVQKQRATQSEDAVQQLNAELAEREQVAGEMRRELDTVKTRCDRLSKEKAQAESENHSFQRRIHELESILDQMEVDKCKDQTNSHRMQEKTTEMAKVVLENEQLRTSLRKLEDKLAEAEAEVSTQRSNIRQYETLVEEYRQQSRHIRGYENFNQSNIYSSKSPIKKRKTLSTKKVSGTNDVRVVSQMNKTRREADEAMARLEDQKEETSRVQEDGQHELDKDRKDMMKIIIPRLRLAWVKSRLENRLQELEPVPEMLKTTELKLQEANEKIAMYDRKNFENSQLIAELSAKLEKQGGQIHHSREKLKMEYSEKKSMDMKMEALERRLMELDMQNRELLQTVSKREETIHQTNMRLDERNQENANLNRQLEQALVDTRRQSETVREKSAAKMNAQDRSMQSRVLDLEQQLSQSRTEMARVKREKEEAERKFNSRLYDLKDRLEQSHSTNRSMQNYVQFLKNSYANVFGDTTVGSSTSVIPPARGSSFHT